MKKLFLLFFLLISASFCFAQFIPQRGRPLPVPGSPQNEPTDPRNQVPPQNEENTEENIDSLREKLDKKKDSIIYNSTYIRYTKEEYLKDSTRLFPIDTTVKNFHRYRILDDPEHPTMNLGLLGLSYRDMLFEPAKTIGFDVGYHYYDRYLLKPEDIIYYKARSPYTDLYYVTPAFGRLSEQMFAVTHSQNIKPNWNIGASFAKKGSRSYYGAPARQADRVVVNHLNAALWTWYESPNKRYTLLANAIFNNLKGYENGSILNDSIFTEPTNVAPEFEESRLSTAKHNWHNNSIYLKQFYNIGKQKTIDSNSNVLPTQRVSYNLQYQTQKFYFTNDGFDDTGLLKNYFIYQDSSKTGDSTKLNHLKNEFNYSFYLRGKSVSFLRNELKVEVGIQHDFYSYEQFTFKTNFQDITLKGNANYGFNDKANLNVKLSQIIQGRNFGDFLYEAQSEIKLGNKIGSVIFEGYSQNQSPALIYERQVTNHYQWNLSFKKITTQHLGFSYVIPKYFLKAKAEYYLVNNHLYFEQGTDSDASPTQYGSAINLLKLSLRKDFKFGKFTFENYLVYQKTDNENILRTPEIYTFHSLYFSQNFFKVLKTDIGIDVKYFSKYTSPKYAPAIGVFYNGGNVQFDTYPIADVWIRTNWKRANLFLRYDYLNQGLFSKGYYTVNRYPMPYSLAKFGVSWKFYD
ncbi:putative porin [Pedobacter psychrophilus]|uniref:putative porin n=1 Tax=Pedobacter psychrophilus TaxID=1826909 RepID=UPI001E50D7A1|nr:putative porin [Pedobacter psychrophilus]